MFCEIHKVNESEIIAGRIHKKINFNTYKWYSLETLKEDEEKLAWLRCKLASTLIGTEAHTEARKQYDELMATM